MDTSSKKQVVNSDTPVLSLYQVESILRELKYQIRPNVDDTFHISIKHVAIHFSRDKDGRLKICFDSGAICQEKVDLMVKKLEEINIHPFSFETIQDKDRNNQDVFRIDFQNDPLDSGLTRSILLKLIKTITTLIDIIEMVCLGTSTSFKEHVDV